MTEKQPENKDAPAARSQPKGGRLIDLEYLVSLPERTLRSGAALLGGASLLISETLLPDVLKETTTYRVTLGDLQRFLILKVGEVHKQAPFISGMLGGDQVEKRILSDDFLRKKLAGNVLEAAGLLTIRFSPLWIFAIAGDAAGGSKVFLERLVTHLKANGVINQDADPQSLTDLLDSVQSASYKSATAVDTPPLSRTELSALAQELTDSYGGMFARGQALLPRFESLQDRMAAVAEEEDASMEEVSGAMALDLASLQAAGGRAATALGQTGSELFGERILNSYTKTLDEIARQGWASYLNKLMTPFLQAAAAHLDPNTLTWTESQLLGRDRPAR
jgi:hypothetical protein